jgi:hypothetical protein
MVNMRCLLRGIIWEEITYDLNQEIKLKGELVDWRTILEDMVQERVWFKGSICLKLLKNWSMYSLDHGLPSKAPFV